MRLQIETAVMMACQRWSNQLVCDYFVKMHDSGEVDSQVFIVMDLLGPSLHDLRKQAPDRTFR